MVRPLRVAVVTKSGEHSGGAWYYEGAVVDLFKALSNSENLEMIVVQPEVAPKGEGATRMLDGVQYPNSRIAKAMSIVASSALGRALSHFLPLSPLHRILHDYKPDLIYFTSPNLHALSVWDFPFIFTVWDLGHRELRGFPEYKSSVEYFLRERILRRCLPRAVATVTDSRATGRKLEETYGIEPGEWVSFGMGFVASAGRPDAGSPATRAPYFLYPAQFWPHKNHSTLLMAFKTVVNVRPEVRLVLIGASKGKWINVKEMIEFSGLENNVEVLGFVDKQEVRRLILGAEALVMPSLLGPTNLPPLEAASLGVKSIISDAHDFDENLDNHTQVVPALDPGKWASAMLECLGTEQPEPLEKDEIAMERLVEVLKNFAKGL